MCRPNLSEFLWKQLHQIQSDREWPEWRDEARPEDQNTSEKRSHYVHACQPLYHAQGKHIYILMLRCIVLFPKVKCAQQMVICILVVA